MILKTSEGKTLAKSGRSNPCQQALSQTHALFNSQDRKVDSCDCIICRYVFDSDAGHGDHAGVALWS